jgi:DNA-3-methyladenine glycosylase I
MKADATDTRQRCPWPGADPLYLAYHDGEWGVPVRDDHSLFEMLLLEGFQAGLSWIIVLRRRETIRRAFDNFDATAMAGWDDAKRAALMADPGIIRNRAKIAAATTNARAYLAIREAGGEGAFARLLWDTVGGRPQINRHADTTQVPAETAESRTMSKALKSASFRFCGPTICYALMQATGMVNDHLTSCFRHGDLT